MGGLASLLRQRAENRHESQMAKDKESRAFLHDQIMGRIGTNAQIGRDNADDPVLSQLTDNYLKLLSPDAKKYAQNSFDALDRLRGALMGGKMQPQQGTQGSAPSTADTTSGSAPAPVPAPIPSKPPNPQGMAAPAAAVLPDAGQDSANNPTGDADTAPPTASPRSRFIAGPSPDASAPAASAPVPNQQAPTPTTPAAKFAAGPPPTAPTAAAPLNIYSGMGDVQARAQAHQLQLQDNEEAYWGQKAKEAGLSDPRDIALFKATKGQKLPPYIRPTAPAAKHMQAVEDYKAAHNLPDTDEGNAEAEAAVGEMENNVLRSQGTPALQAEWYRYPTDKPGDPPHPVRINPKNLTKLDSNTGKPVPEGATKIDEKLLEDQVRSNSYGQYGQFYKAAKGAGLSDADAAAKASAETEAWYQNEIAHMWAGHTRESMGIGANNESIPITLQSGPTGQPATILNNPRSSAGTPAAPSSAPAPQTGGGGTAVPAAPSPIPAPQRATPAAANPVKVPAAFAPRTLEGVSPATARMAAQFSVPITESIVQMFGDESKTGVKPLVSFADLADNDASSKRLGRAINLTRSALGDQIKDASIGANGGGFHVSDGGIIQWVENKLGIPGAVAESDAEMLRSALKSLTPREREAYDATMSEMSVMAGLRSLSRSSAAASNIRLVENELARLGTTASRDQYLDQMQRVGNALRNAIGTPGLFPLVRDPQTGKNVPVGINPDALKQLDTLPDTIKGLRGNKRPIPAPTSKGPSKSNDLKSKSNEELLQLLLAK